MTLTRSARTWLRAKRSEALEYRASSAMVDGFSLHLPRHFRYHYVERAYEPLSMEFIRRNAPVGGTAVDVGGHIGFVTMHIARTVGPGGKVFVFEPASQNVRYIRKNLRANKIANVAVVRSAVGASDGWVSFNITGSSDSHGIYEHPLSRTRRTTRVRITRLDAVVAPPVGFFKIDTEGAEVDVLDGMRSLIARSPEACGLVEWTPACQARAGRKVTDLIDRLRAFGFRLGVIDDASGRECSVDEILDRIAQGLLPDDWYGNIACTPGDR